MKLSSSKQIDEMTYSIFLSELCLQVRVSYHEPRVLKTDCRDVYEREDSNVAAIIDDGQPMRNR